MLSSGSEKKPARRRVPDSQRRRTLVSCDRCKTRRIRCCRNNENESCTSCLNGGVKCESTLPRKQRVYGSVERFSLRYRALDALVRGLFPNEDTDDIEVLFQLGRNHNIPMPSPDDESHAPEAFNQDTIAATSKSPVGNTDVQMIKDDCPAFEVVYERMVPGPRRILHYVGPSSSSEFASIIRHLVTRYKKITNPTSCSQAQAHDKKATSNLLHSRSKAAPSFANGHSIDSAIGEGQQTEMKSWGARKMTPLQQGQASLPSSKRPSQDLSSGVDKSSNLRSLLRDLLPQRRLCDALVQAYLDNLHGPFQVFYKPIFQLRYNLIWDNEIAQTGNTDVGWTCCLFMVIILGADILGPEHCPDSILIQTKYMRLVRDSFQALVFTATLENVQALLLLQLYEQNSGERNTSWLILGLAVRMAITLGMHREGTYASFDKAEAHTRRVVWWTLYQVEFNMSMILGRPPTINAKEVNVSLPEDGALDGIGYPLGFEDHYLKMTNIGYRVRRLITIVTPKYTDESALLSHQEQIRLLLQQLEAWKAQLPHHFAPESPMVTIRHRRAVILLQALYYHHRSVLTRAFLACRSSRSIDRLSQEPNQDLGPVTAVTEYFSRECRTSSLALLDCFLHLSKYGLLEGVAWIDFYYICHSVMALGLFELGQPSETASDPEYELSTSKIAAVNDIVTQVRLAPTYKIFTKVTLGFARTVGLGIRKPSPAEEVGTQQQVFQEPPQPSTLSSPYTSVPYGQVPWSMPEMNNSPMVPAPTENTLSPPGLLGWFWHEANSGSHMPWDMFNLGNIQLSGAEYMEAPPQSYTTYTGQQHWPS
ncbi:conserved hypothetical protein [Talaromyces stipitatus ATCC 10500]|uniref:Zn(2)-C6 fungal-type domain-containing protein n=1 Tax=Talaromyces stipitatus (strain ATCC 10500 / CBS 375.48 / QM 6759 / NRRL 1006) TaxID=441959 RepID=B8M5F4_TALSN|nr:uncharacterized protein TSTA_030270 [Talaromyces stipitatus ATCC 10500]EED19760.1 conserved hypothetical protein [Talaromyces stipitatus ATCC 10500]